MVALWERIIERLLRSSYKCWLWEANLKMSRMFLVFPVDRIGYIDSPVFQVAMATYLGQPYPLMVPLVGHSFGENAKRLDLFGANLAAVPLPGYGWRVLYNSLQVL